MIWSVDLNHALVVFNSAVFDEFKDNHGILISPGMRPCDFSPPDVAAQWPPMYDRALSEGHFHTEYRMADGRYFDLSLDRIVNEHGEVTGIAGNCKDITEQRATQAGLAASNRQLKLLSAINRALTGIEAEDEQSLFDKYCRILVETGGYLMAWVGLPETSEGERVIPLASFGPHADYLKVVDIRWSETITGRGIVGRAIRTGKVQLSANIHVDKRMTPWRAEALKRGFHSAIALPFQTAERGMACLVAYGDIDHCFSESETDLMKEVASDLGFGVQTLKTANAKAKFQRDLRASLEQTIQVIADTVDQRDPYTAGHERRVSDLCTHLAKELGLSDDCTHGLHLAASIHDLGKIGIPAEILAKPGKLSEMQYNLIKEHVQLGYDLLRKVDFPWPIADIIMQHHERLDGSGYPHGLKAEDLMLESRILAVADVVEAMSSHRPYRPSRGVPVALDEITSMRGILYDVKVVDACVRLFQEAGYKFPA